VIGAVTAVRFSPDVPASFGGAAGQSIPGETEDGSVVVTPNTVYLPLMKR
jgi:hypothetical protein